jgi:acyl-[acyl-carrier-protein]-phospholipid O-acyltransferase/long-chain-fatty-acid--[acyl-carrier-protein] ligase
MRHARTVTHLSYEEGVARSQRDRRTLGSAFLAHARRHPRAVAVRDYLGPMSRIKLAGAALAAVPLFGLAPREDNVGVLLPPGQAGTLVNLALALAGRTAVNLNFTSGAWQLERTCTLTHLKTVITASAFLERVGNPSLPVRVVLVEDVVGRLSKRAVLARMLAVLLLPHSRLDRARPRQVAAIVLSSGTTAEPKGVQLTHQQILANCDAMMEHLELTPGHDVLATALPLFHSFGLVPGMWLCLVEGYAIAAHPDPTDGAALGAVSAAAKATFLIATPSFVRAYMRRIEPEQLRTLRFAFVGAERCPTELRVAFKDKYGAELLEGYGTTELAPVVSVNTVHEIRDGSVGRPLPGVEVFTMSPETGQILPPGETGVLVVRSPARMLGYLDRPDLTEAAFVHGGYDTGDIGRVDEDGFVYITGRLARFAKVGGEMVPLDPLEARLQQAADERCVSAGEIAVTSVSDGRKGERIVVLYTGLPCSPEELLADLSDVPAIFRPRVKDFFAVDEIPVLGTGKRDLGAMRRVAEELCARPTERRPGMVRAILERVRH